MSNARQEQASEILARLERQNKVGTPKSIAFVLRFLRLGGNTIAALRAAVASYSGISEKEILLVVDLMSVMELLAVHENTIECSDELQKYLPENQDLQLDWFIDVFIEYALKSRIIDIEYISYNIELRQFVMSKGSIKSKNACFRNLLCDFDVIQRLPDASFVICDKLDKAIKQPQHHRRISEDQLMKRLQQQREQGERGEEFVLMYEKQRISDPSKKERVQRISIIDVAAGFDIVSFNSNQSRDIDRYIEVKTYNGSEHFYWSRNEIEKAKLMGDDYYLYLVDDECIDKIGYEPIIIRNPIVAIGQSQEWIKRADSLYVERMVNGCGREYVNFAIPGQIDWTTQHPVPSEIKLVNAIESIGVESIHINAGNTKLTVASGSIIDMTLNDIHDNNTVNT